MTTRRLASACALATTTLALLGAPAATAAVLPDGALGSVTDRPVVAGSLESALVGTGSARACAPLPAADTATAEGWIGVLAQHRDTVSLRIDDGRHGVVVDHRPAASQQSASTIKSFHLAAYAEAVTAGRIDPEQRVPVSEWESFYYPADGGAHATALKRLDIPATGTETVAVATDQSTPVRIDDIVSAMIRESDNAATDFLRDRLGAAAVDAVVTRVGARGTKVTSITGATILATAPSVASGTPDEVLARYRTDPAFVESLGTAQPAGVRAQAEWFAANGMRTTAADLDALYRHVATNSLPGSDLIRRHLEWKGPAADGSTIGFKGGSLPTMVGIGFEKRRTDGSVATGALLLQGMDEATYAQALRSPGWQQLVVAAAEKPEVADRLRCALG